MITRLLLNKASLETEQVLAALERNPYNGRSAKLNEAIVITRLHDRCCQYAITDKERYALRGLLAAILDEDFFTIPAASHKAFRIADLKLSLRIEAEIKNKIGSRRTLPQTAIAIL